MTKVKKQSGTCRTGKAVTIHKWTAADVVGDLLDDATLSLIQRGVACIEKVQHAHGDIINKLDTLTHTLADIKAKCEEGGFKAICAKFFPDIPEKTAYHKARLGSMTAVQLSDYRVKRANQENARRKAVKAKVATDAAELAKLKSGQANGTLLHNGEAHPTPAAPMTIVLHGADSKSGKPGTVTQVPTKGTSGDNKAQVDAAVKAFAEHITALTILMAGGVKPAKFVKANVTSETLMKVAGLCTGVVAARQQAERLARIHNLTAEQSAETMKAAHAANENAAAPAAAA